MKQIVLITLVVFLSSSMSLAQNFCQGDFNYDGNVAADDVSTFLAHFGRSQFNNPCPPDGPTPVPKTGQTTSYYEGDDGDLEKGVEWPNPRFTDNGNGTITDNLSGLIWLKDANCFGRRNWEEAITDCNVLAAGENLCSSGTFSLTDGSSGGDWRLPNKFELESLLDIRYWNPALSNTAGNGQWSYGDPFINLEPSLWYWSSTTYAYDTNTAWCLHMPWAKWSNAEKSWTTYFLPVRGGR